MTPDAFGAASFLDAALAGGRRAQPSFGGGAAGAVKAARDFEGFYLAQVVDSLTAGLDVDGPFGGGSGEKAFRGFLNQAYADAIVQAGGVGLASRLAGDIAALQLAGQEAA